MTPPTSSVQATVIVPTTGNRGPLLSYSVGSVLAQSVGDLEVFIMGDGVDDATRAVIAGLMSRDSRVRFFDHPKDVRRGEIHRHAALQEARGEIVCYLTDRDFMLPNHIAVMSELLSRADFGHTLRFSLPPDGVPRFEHHLDINDPAERKSAPTVTRLIPLSFGGHTLRMYRDLPHGWRTTPVGKFTDFYMWEQFLAHPRCRTATSTKPTILYLKRGSHPGWPVEQRLAELKLWSERIASPIWLQEFEENVRDGAIRGRARIAQAARVAAPVAAAASPLPANGPDQTQSRSSSALSKTRTRKRKPFLTGAEKYFPNSVEWIRRRIRYLRKEPPRSVAAHITELQKKHIQSRLRIETYWVGGKFGPGPGASVYAYDDEVMRFDCFGEPKGHMHINMKQSRLLPGGGSARIKLPGSATDNIERAFFELTHNLEYCLKLNQNRRIRRIKLKRERLSQAADWMRGNLLRLSTNSAKIIAATDPSLNSLAAAEDDA